MFFIVEMFLGQAVPKFVEETIHERLQNLSSYTAAGPSIIMCIIRNKNIITRCVNWVAGTYFMLLSRKLSLVIHSQFFQRAGDMQLIATPDAIELFNTFELGF